jgi:hypothetical protein
MTRPRQSRTTLTDSVRPRYTRQLHVTLAALSCTLISHSTTAGRYPLPSTYAARPALSASAAGRAAAAACVRAFRKLSGSSSQSSRRRVPSLVTSTVTQVTQELHSIWPLSAGQQPTAGCGTSAYGSSLYTAWHPGPQ